MPAGVVVTGFTELNRSIAASGPAVKKAMRHGLREAAEPISHLAEQLSLTKIGVHHKFPMQRSPQWAKTRIGVTQGSVYIVPKLHGVKPGNPKNRPNLVGEMMHKSFEPALEAGTPIAEQYVTRLIEEVIDA